jgi:hypothetical protein
MEQRAARGFEDADRFVAALALDRELGALQIRVVQQIAIFSAACSVSIMRAQ